MNHFKNVQTSTQQRLCDDLFTYILLLLSLEVVEVVVVVQFSSVQSSDRLGRRGDMRDDSAEILFQSVLHEALVSSSGTGFAGTKP